MKRFMLACLLAIPAFGQIAGSINQTANGTITAASSSCTATSCVYIVLPLNAATLSAALTGTFSATVQFESSVDDLSWFALADSAASTSATTTGLHTFTLSGQQFVRVRCSAYTSGSVAVAMSAGLGPGSGAASSVAWNAITNPTGNQALTMGTSTTTWTWTSGTTAFSIANGGGTIIDVDATNGRVGIGTTGPGSKLEVNGQIGVAVGTQAAPAYSFAGALAQGFYQYSSNTIGYSTGSYTPIALGLSGISLLNSGNIAWVSGTTNGSGGAGDTNLSRLSAGKMGVGNGTNGDVSGTLIAGNVGIGTTAPGDKLEVDSSGSGVGITNMVGIIVANANGTTNNWAGQLFSDGNVGGSASALMGVQMTDRTNHYGDFAFGTRGAGGFTEKMRITSNGNVGIGTTSPGQKLAVVGNGTFSAAVATLTVLTANLQTCTASTGTPWRAAVSDATAPAIGVALTGGGTVFALVHCSLTTGTYIVDGI